MCRPTYYAASIDNCPINLNSKKYSDETINKLWVLAKDICCLLNLSLKPRRLEWFSQKYKTLLIDKGLANANNRAKVKKLIDDFIFFYGREMLESVDSMVDYEDEQNWLVSIVRKHRKSFHPVRHLLVIRFLTNSCEEFFQTNYKYKPFGNAPWLCLNAAADHYLQAVVTNVSITHCLENKKPLGTFSCDCGMLYSRTGPDETKEDKLRIGKIIQFGSVWEQKLKELVEVDKLGLRETARRLNVDSRTVCRYVAKLKLKSYWRTSKDNQPTDLLEVSQSNLDSLIDIQAQHRQAWMTLQHQHPEASKTTLRRFAPAVYTWLYRNDNDWLNQNSPALQKPVPSVAKVDWAQRDRQVLDKVKDAVRSLLDEDKPARITISRVGKTIGLLALVEKHLDQMSLTKAYLESVTETVEDFQIRRIQWAIKQLDDCGEEILRWKVVRVARLREDCSERVKAALETEIYRKSN